MLDAVPDLAEVLPTTWIPDLLGWPVEGREKLLDWAAATFNGFGPPNNRTNAAAQGISRWRRSPHSWPPVNFRRVDGSRHSRCRARGDLSADQCPMAIIDYLGPSLDTTISGLGNAIWLFSTHPEQWQRLRRDPGRAKQAFDEALRLESPVTGFTRVTTRAGSIGGVELPVGARVLVSTRRPIGTSGSGMTRRSSTSNDRMPRTSPLATANTLAQAWAWHDWKRRRS